MNTAKNSALLAALLLAAPALSAAGREPFALGGVDLSRDTDDFRVENYSAGAGLYFSDNNTDRAGYRHSEIHYSAPEFHTHGRSESLFGAKRISDSFDASGELTQTHLDNGQNKTLGWGQLSGQPNTASNIEVRYEKNLVESANALNAGITYSALSVAGDYQLTDRWNLAGVAGRFDFSDGNERPFYRLKTSWVVSETYGVSVYARTRKYSDSDPYNGYYFAPRHFQDYLGGFAVRRRLPWVHGTLSGQIDWGRQSADGDTTPARSWLLRLESWAGTRWSYAIATGYSATAGVGGGGNYQYRYSSASVVFTF